MKLFGKKDHSPPSNKSSDERSRKKNATNGNGIPSCISSFSSEKRGSKESTDILPIIRFSSLSNLDSSSSSNVTRKGGVTLVQKERDKGFVRFSPNTKRSEINFTFKRDEIILKQPKIYTHPRRKKTIKESREERSSSYGQGVTSDKYYYDLYQRSKSKDLDSAPSSWKSGTSVASKDLISSNHPIETNSNSISRLHPNMIDNHKVQVPIENVRQPRTSTRKKKSRDNEYFIMPSGSESVNLNKYRNKYETPENCGVSLSSKKFILPTSKSFASSCQSIDEIKIDDISSCAIPRSEATNYNVEYPWSSDRNHESFYTDDENESCRDSDDQSSTDSRIKLSKLRSTYNDLSQHLDNHSKKSQENEYSTPKNSRVRFQTEAKIYTQTRGYDYDSIAPSYASSYVSEYEYGPYRCIRPSDFFGGDDYSHDSSSYEDDYSQSVQNSVRTVDCIPPCQIMCSPSKKTMPSKLRNVVEERQKS